MLRGDVSSIVTQLYSLNISRTEPDLFSSQVHRRSAGCFLRLLCLHLSCSSNRAADCFCVFSCFLGHSWTQRWSVIVFSFCRVCDANHCHFIDLIYTDLWVYSGSTQQQLHSLTQGKVPATDGFTSSCNITVDIQLLSKAMNLFLICSKSLLKLFSACVRRFVLSW